jgi:hypothetical protein
MRKIFLILITGALAGLFACSPIEKREELGPIASPDDIDVVAHSINGTNKIVLKNNTLQYGGMWDYKFGTSTKMTDTVIVPVIGTYDITYFATTAGGIVEKTVSVTIDSMTYTVPGYSELTGNGEGKTWVYDKQVCDNGNMGKFCYLGPPDPAKWDKIWWDPGCKIGDDWYTDENAAIEFKINGANTICTFIPETGDPLVGSFVLDMHNMKLTVKQPAHIPDYNHPNTLPGNPETGLYTICVLDEDHLILYQAQQKGWFWRFKPKDTTK